MGPEEIKALQQQLAARGLYRGKIDGIMGADTAAAAQAMRQQDTDAAKASAAQRQQEEQLRLQQEQVKLQQAQQEQARIETERQRATEDYQRSPAGQAIETGKLIAPLGAGMALGHHQAKGIEARQSAMDPVRQASMGTGRRFAPYAARAGTYFIPEGLALREWVAPQIENKTARDLTKGVGTGLLAAGFGTLGEGAVRSLTPPKVPDAPMGFGLPPAPPQGGVPPASPPPPAEPVGPQRHSDRLVAAARAAGASGRLTKESAAEFLAAGVTDANRKAVGDALGVKPGPNFAKRIGAAVKSMASTRGASSIALPLAAGAYAASTTESEAGDGGGGGPSLTDRAIAGGAAAGGVAGGQYLMSKLPQAIGGALGAGGAMLTPMAISDAVDEGYWTPERMESARAEDLQRVPAWARRLESMLGFPALENLHQMAQLPERNPFRQQGLPYGAMGFGLPPR